MENSPPELAIGFIVREKFSAALESLNRIYRFTDIPFKLYFVNTGYPPAILQELQAFLQDKEHVLTLNYDRFLLPNESLNEIIQHLTEPALCVVENDVMVEPGYIQSMLKVLHRHHCGIVSPRIYHGFGEDKLHFDPPISVITKQAEHYVSDVVRYPKPGYQLVEGERQIFHIEKHCFLMTQAAAKVICPLETFLNTREQIDFSLKAFEAGQTIFMDPNAYVSYMPPPIEPVDEEFFRFRWDVDCAQFSNDYIEKKWRLLNFRKSMEFIHEMNKFL